MLVIRQCLHNIHLTLHHYLILHLVFMVAVVRVICGRHLVRLQCHRICSNLLIFKVHHRLPPEQRTTQHRPHQHSIRYILVVREVHNSPLAVIMVLPVQVTLTSLTTCPMIHHQLILLVMELELQLPALNLSHNHHHHHLVREVQVHPEANTSNMVASLVPTTIVRNRQHHLNNRSKQL